MSTAGRILDLTITALITASALPVVAVMWLGSRRHRRPAMAIRRT